jgi:hypothetical protein
MTKSIRALSAAFIAASMAGITLVPAGLQAEPLIIKENGPHDYRPSKVDVTASAGFFGDVDFGVAGWYSTPLVRDGFITAINNSFNLEVGAAIDYAFANYGTGCDYNYTRIVPMGGVRWDFYLTKAWTVFGKAKAGPRYDVVSASCNGTKITNIGGFGLGIDAGVGAFWNFSTRTALRLELGYQGVAAGFSFNL